MAKINKAKKKRIVTVVSNWKLMAGKTPLEKQLNSLFRMGLYSKDKQGNRSCLALAKKFAKIKSIFDVRQEHFDAIKNEILKNEGAETAKLAVKHKFVEKLAEAALILSANHRIQQGKVKP